MFRPATLALLATLTAATSHAQTVRAVLSSPNEDPTSRFGRSISDVPDVDGDGVDDLAVSAYLEGASGVPLAGRVYVLSGATLAVLTTLGSPTPRAEGFFGNSVAGLPDLDGDGAGDVFVGAPLETAGQPFLGLAHVFSGATGALLLTFASSATGTGSLFGVDVEAVPDLDGDGLPELVVGSPNEANGGLVYVFSGASGALLYTLAPPDPEQSTFFGRVVTAVEDLDGDGLAEIAVGSPFERNEDPGAGAVHVFSGASGAPLLRVASPTNREFAASLADLGGGRLLVGAPEVSGSEGVAYVVDLGTGAIELTLRSPLEGDSDEAFGDAVGAVPDLDGDGLAEALVGSPRETPPGAPLRAGRAYVLSGADGTLLYTLEPNVEDDESDSLFGGAVAGFVGDRGPEVLVGAIGAGDDGTSPGGPGRVYVFGDVRTTAAAPEPAPAAVAVGAPFPNPAARRAAVPVMVPVALPAPAYVHAAAYDALGRRVAVLQDGPLPAGRTALALDGAALPPGAYVIRVRAGGATAAVRLVLAR